MIVKLIEKLIERIEYGDITRDSIVSKLEDIKNEIPSDWQEL